MHESEYTECKLIIGNFSFSRGESRNEARKMANRSKIHSKSRELPMKSAIATMKETDNQFA